MPLLNQQLRQHLRPEHVLRDQLMRVVQNLHAQAQVIEISGFIKGCIKVNILTKMFLK